MSKLIRLEIRSFPATRVIGKQVACGLGEDTENPGTALWDTMLTEGTLEFLMNLPQRATPDRDAVGWMGEYDSTSNTYTYIAGILAEPGTPVPSGYVYRDIPACMMAIGWIQGTDSGHDIYIGAHDHIAKAMQERGYEYDPGAGGFEIEYHSHLRFSIPMARGDEFVVLDYYSPCRKRER
jgi:predicted transcriptional regulator YdeE